MSRKVTISLPSGETESILSEIGKLDGLIGLAIQKNSSVKPKGDIISVCLTNDALSPLFRLLEKADLLKNEEINVTTSRPLSVISKACSTQIDNEGNDSNWEEALNSINHESSMRINGILLMLLSGFIAALGLLTDSLHIVIAAMVVAPGFEPIVRMVLSAFTKSKNLKYGIRDTLRAYLSLLAGALIGSAVFQFFSEIPASSYLDPGSLISYWTTLTATSLAVSAAASMVGALVVLTNKSVLTAGVMIALALIPAGCIIVIGLVNGDFSITVKAFIRLLLEIGIITLFSGIVIYWKKVTVHKRLASN